MKTILKLSLIYSSLLIPVVFAGTQAVMKSSQQDTTMISVEGSKLRIEQQGNENSIAIFDTAKKEMLMIDLQDRSYRRMNKANFDKIKQKMDDARKQIEEKMANMPPEQRDMIKNMMGNKLNMFAQSKPKETEFVETKRTDKAAGYSCNITEYFVNGQKKTEFCVTSQEKIKGADDIYRAMQNMSLMFKEIFESLSESFPMMAESNPFSEIEKLGGYPLIITDFGSSSNNQRNELKSIDTKSFDKSFFLPPEGFKEKKMDTPNF
jgi:hypothetical protein